MFFVSGSKIVVLCLGLIGNKYCQICERDRPFYRYLQYQLHHIWWLFRWTRKKRYYSACEICSRGEELDRAEVEGQLERSPIPFLDRFGWTIIVAIGAVLFVMGILSPSKR